MARIIQIDDRRWLAGMNWSSFEEKPSKEELEEDASRFGATWACVRIGTALIQAGFCEPVEDVKRPSKLYSLAAMLAGSRQQPWQGVFKIEEGLWWYIAVRDSYAILPDGDVIGGIETIYAAKERHAGYADWNSISGDMNLLINLLHDCIDDPSVKPMPVRALYAQAVPVIPVVAAIVLIAIIAGAFFWWQKKQREEHERQVAIEKMRAQIAATQRMEPAPSPLTTTPQPNNWLACCGQIITALPLSQKGWALDAASCNTTSVAVHWVRRDGATVASTPDGRISPQGDGVDQAIPLVGLDKTGNDNAIDLPEAKRMLQAWAQAAGFTLAMTDVAPPPAVPGAQTGQNASQNAMAAPKPQANIVLDISISPFHIDFSSIPGLRLNSLSITNAGWHLEGVLYGR